MPIDAVFPDGQTDEQADQESAAEMANSQQEAVAAAFEELDIAYQVVVDGVIDGAPADGVLEAGDQLLTANGAAIEGITDLRAAIAENGTDQAGRRSTVLRDGAERVLTMTPVPASADDPTPIVGIQAGYVFPFDVTIQLENVGGPSAGTMFALGIYDKLTEGALTGGTVFAGTGTIRADGDGRPDRRHPAEDVRRRCDAGATVFLAPESNCDEVTGHIPSGLSVFAIETLDDALDVVQTVAAGELYQRTRELSRLGCIEPSEATVPPTQPGATRDFHQHPGWARSQPRRPRHHRGRARPPGDRLLHLRRPLRRRALVRPAELPERAHHAVGRDAGHVPGRILRHGASPVWLSIWIAFRSRPVYAKLNSQLDRYQQVIEPLRRLAMYGIPIVLGIFMGVSTATRWSTVLQYLNRTPFGEIDPQFGLDVSFYVYELPFYRGVLAYASAVFLVAGARRARDQLPVRRHPDQRP